MGNLFNYAEARKATSLNQIKCEDNENRESPELIAAYLCPHLWRHGREAKSRFDHFTASQSLFIRSPSDAAIHVYQLRNRLQCARGSHNSQKNGKRCTNIRHEWCRKSPRNLFPLFCQKAFRGKPSLASHAYMHHDCLFMAARSWAK